MRLDRLFTLVHHHLVKIRGMVSSDLLSHDVVLGSVHLIEGGISMVDAVTLLSGLQEPPMKE